MAYKGFNLISAGTPAPWGPTEEQNWKDMADTVLLDCVTLAKDATYGHKHKSLYNPDGSAALTPNDYKAVAFEHSNTLKRWPAIFTSLQFQNGFSIATSVSNDGGADTCSSRFLSNAWFDNTNNRWQYIRGTSGYPLAASWIELSPQGFDVLIAPAGVAGAAVTFALPKLSIDAEGCDITLHTVATDVNLDNDHDPTHYVTMKDSHGTTIYMLCRTQAPV